MKVSVYNLSTDDDLINLRMKTETIVNVSCRSKVGINLSSWSVHMKQQYENKNSKHGNTTTKKTIQTYISQTSL